ncbi:hypothetical protein [Thermanaerosceptrum fracticalcis]|uniref:hypothetical protein n=1 Tax=Thermanaerosceptrum fracticalcis TaxID=1712410 RepID=UPI003B82CC2A
MSQRQENQLKRRIRAGHFPLNKSLDEFKLNHLPHVQEATVWELATGGLHRNLLFYIINAIGFCILIR